jgi:hypothetical protein
VLSGKGVGRQKVWGYCLTDLAELFDMSEPALRKAVSRGAVDPADLKSIVAFALLRMGATEPVVDVEEIETEPLALPAPAKQLKG